MRKRNRENKKDKPLSRLPIDEELRRRTYFEQFNVELTGHKVPERVCLLGPGVNAANEDAYKRITADFIVAIDCAIEVPECETINWPVDKSITGWFVAEQDAAAVPWYQDRFKDIKVPRYFSINVCVYGVGTPPQWDKSISLHTYRLGGRNLFKYRSTPLGIAAHLMAFCGAKYIELCGFDQSGNEYYNHTVRKASFHPALVRGCEEQLIALIESGIEIVSLNRIALESVNYVYNNS